MSSPIRLLAKQIVNAEKAFELSDSSLLYAHEALAKFFLQGFKPLEEWIEQAPIGYEDVILLKDALEQYVRNHPDHPSRAMAIRVRLRL
ncbi:hypothetical protein [Roseibacillus ishigakijimensis]|uniref:hypothetical protein n=1 Tax=Roseibacillus ishigakijimensis TaxID=454146 RepID=UPI001905FB12|nr:hypothetical protein [Roseibacillus ishigakijimensis]